MKKSLLALAVLGAFAGAASAQTSVTLYGSIDAGVRNVTNINAVGDSRLTMGSLGTYSPNRWGVKSVEDLGSGMNAHFVLEGGFNSGTGALAGDLFSRSAYVGLGGSWGSLDLGHQYSVNFKTIGAYDPFNYKYTGIIPLATQGALTRFNNDIQYTGTFGLVTARAEYALGEQPGSTSDGSAQAFGLSYAGGPFSVGGAYTQRKNSVGTPASFEDQKNWTIGGTYAASPFRLAIGYADSKQEFATVADTDTKDTWIGGSVNVSPAIGLNLAYYQTKMTTATSATTTGEGKRKLLIAGATYALSKRTNFYADIDNAKFSGTMIPAGQSRQTGISAGINHLF